MGDAGVIVTHNSEYADRCQYLRNYGAKVKYHHEYFGFNSRLDSIQAVMVDEKLKFLDEWNDLKNSVAERYDTAFLDIEELNFWDLESTHQTILCPDHGTFIPHVMRKHQASGSIIPGKITYFKRIKNGEIKSFK